MNNRSVWRAVAIVVLGLAVAVAIGLGAYNAGVAHGIAESGKAVAAPPAASAPYVYVWPYYHWGFGFFPPFFLFFLFFILYGLIWRGSRWGWGRGYRGQYGAAPPYWEEWHRRAHEQPPPPAGPRTTV